MVYDKVLRPHKDVWSHTPRVGGGFVTPWSGFSCLKRCRPIVFAWDILSCLGYKSKHNIYSHPLTTSTAGYAPSPSSVNAARTMGHASRKAVGHHFSLLPGHQVLRNTLIDELFSQEKSERIFRAITWKACVCVPYTNSIFYTKKPI